MLKFIYYCFYRSCTLIFGERWVVNTQYKIATRRFNANFNKLITLNDWLNWMKSNYLLDNGFLFVDKAEVKNYIKTILGEQYIVPTIDLLQNVDDLNKNLKKYQYPLIIKPTHDSGGGIFMYEYRELSKSELIKLRRRLYINYGHLTNEKLYCKVPPRLIVEELLLDEYGNIPHDFKFVCIGGKVEFIYLSFDRLGANKRTVYDRNGEILKSHSVRKYSTKLDKSDFDLILPLSQDELTRSIKLSERIAADFPFVRVDLYVVNEKIYVGELTFIFGGGFDEFLPYNWNVYLGGKLKEFMNV